METKSVLYMSISMVGLYETGALELYNLKNDVSEANDLAKKCLGNIGKCIICLLFIK